MHRPDGTQLKIRYMIRLIKIPRYNVNRPDGTIKPKLKSDYKTVITDMKKWAF